MKHSLSRVGRYLLTTSVVATIIISFALPAVVGASESTLLDSPPIVTGDIKAGIEKHIAEQVAQGDGYFTVDFEGQELRLNLVRVHIEYLASLAPQSHFACVDMASSDGEFYDIDFFLEGDPGAMTVTDTTG